MVAVVTGATSGIGRAFAERLAAEGYDLIITGRREALLADVALGIRSATGRRIDTVAGDLTEPQIRSALVDALGSAPVRILVNNAGAGFSAHLADATPDDATRLSTLLADVPRLLVQATLPSLVERGGIIINVGSLAGRLPVPGASVYVAAKSYVERLSETIALELSGAGVVVQALLPGFVRTDFHREIPDFRRKQRSRGLIRWATPQYVVSVSLRAALRASRRLERSPDSLPRPRDVVVIPGMLNRALAAFAPFLPRRLLYRATVRRKPLQ